MKWRFPLYARILGLFLLNVLVIATAFVVVFRMQFHFGLDSFLAGQANRRVHALSDVVIRELQDSPTSQIDSVLARFSRSFGVDLYVFRANGDQVAGTPIVLPPQVDASIRRQGPGRGRGGPPGGGLGRQRGPRFGQQAPAEAEPEPTPTPAELPGPAEQPPPRSGPEAPVRDDLPAAGRGAGPGWRWLEGAGPRAMPPDFFIRSANPTRYWAGAFFPGRRPGSAGQLHVLLIASNSITGGGLFFDFTPWVVAGVAGLLLSALIWLPFVRSITRSLARMARTTSDISLGRFDARVASRRGDELGRLAGAIDDMAGRLEGFVNGQRRFLGDIAHELCSPLARIQTALGILEQRAQPKDQPYVRDLQEEAEHMSQLVGELLSFSRATIDRAKTHLEATSLAGVVAKAVRREQVENVVIQQNIPSDLIAQANAELLQRAVSNLLRNALRHAGQSGPVTLAGRRDGTEVVLEVTDNGPGVPEESLSKLFDPFYRVDPSRTRETGGVGLGMTIVKTCVEACGGTVQAANRPTRGLMVQIRLPAETSPQSPDAHEIEHLANDSIESTDEL